MLIKQINIDEFENFANNHPYDNYHQSYNYALLLAEEDFDYEYIGLFDDDILKAAALVFSKNIQGYTYGYIPEGFLIDYEDMDLVDSFSEQLYKFYSNKKFVFLKTNPRIPIGIYNQKKKMIEANENRKFIRFFDELGYTRLGENLYFESQLPRMSAIVDYKKYKFNKLKKNVRNKYRNALRHGLVFEEANYEDLDKITSFIDTSIINDSKYHFQDYYSIFSKTNDAKAFLVRIDYHKFLQNAQVYYNNEKKKNDHLCELIKYSPSKKNVNAKMNSDATLEAYHNDIIAATQLSNEESKYIAGGIVIKHNNKATLVLNGFDKKYKMFMPNYFLYVNILEYFKDEVEYFDLNGVSADFRKDSPYYGLNQFKLSFNPDVYEYIGEYDLIIDSLKYNIMLKKGILADEFNKRD